METFFHGGTELPNVMFMYMQYAGWMARMDGRRIERARESIEEGGERGVGGRGGGLRRTTNNNIYKPTRHFTPITITINITINQHHFFQKPFQNLISHHPKTNPKKCNSSPSSPPLPSQPQPLQSSRPEVERKSAPVEHHTVANWTFWASLLFLARMVSTYST